MFAPFMVIIWLTSPFPCRRPAIFFRPGKQFSRTPYRHARVTARFAVFFRKIASAPKSFSRPAVIPFRGRKQPDGSDLM
jgi:hypothetical protein